MSIHIDSCAARTTIIVRTRSTEYELVVLRGKRGLLLVRGGRYFPQFRRALFLGSAADDGSVEPRTIDIGLRMKFVSGNRSFLTSAVQSICRPAASAARGSSMPDGGPGPASSRAKTHASFGITQRTPLVDPPPRKTDPVDLGAILANSANQSSGANAAGVRHHLCRCAWCECRAAVRGRQQTRKGRNALSLRIQALIVTRLGIGGMLAALLALGASPVLAQTPEEPSSRAGLMEQARETSATQSVAPERSAIDRGLSWYDNQYLFAKLFGRWNGIHLAGGDFPAGAGLNFGFGYDKALTAGDPDPLIRNRVDLTAAGSVQHAGLCAPPCRRDG